MTRFASVREMFEAASEAARDAERISRQLAEMDESSLSIGGGGFEPRVRSTPDPDRIGRAVSVTMDYGEVLRMRQDEDYRLIDACCIVLYGEDNRGGLWALTGWWADAIYHHYLALRTWEFTGKLLGYSAEHCCRCASAAFDVADAWGMASVVDGMGNAT